MLNEEQEMLNEMALRFLGEKNGVSLFRETQATNSTLSPQIWTEMAEMGWLSVLTGEELEGDPFGYVGTGVIAQAMGRNLTLVPFVSTGVMAAVALQRSERPQSSLLLNEISTGKSIIAFAIDEGAKHAPDSIKVHVEESPTGYCLSGFKTFVMDGADANTLIVAARPSHDLKSIGLFLVDAKATGVIVTKTIAVDGRGFANIEFDNVKLSKESLLSTSETGSGVFQEVLNAGRVAIAHELVGSADALFDLTLTYMKQREQFGKIIGSFQALHHRMAQLHTELCLARAIVRKAAVALDTSHDSQSLLASVAKSKAGEVAKLCANEAIQLHGGIGVTAEYDAGLYLKRIRVSQEYLGDDAYHADCVALMSGY